MPETIAGIKIPDSRMAEDLTELIRDKEPDLFYQPFQTGLPVRRPDRSAQAFGL
jgi:hypothetical protein